MPQKKQSAKRPLEKQNSDTSPTLQNPSKMPNLQRSPPKKEAELDQMALLNKIQEMFSSNSKDMADAFARQERAIMDSEERVKEAMSERIAELEEKMTKIESAHDNLAAQNAELSRKIEELERKNLAIERDAKRLNIVISGLEFKNQSEGFQKAKETIESLTESRITVQGVRTVFTKNGNKIVATCNNTEEKSVIMRAKKRLAETGRTNVFINSDMPKEDREAEWKFRNLVKQLRNEGKNVTVERGGAKVDGKWLKFERGSGTLIEDRFRNVNENLNVECARPQRENRRH